MPRLFTALPLPPAVASHLTLLRGGVRDARWIEPADYHITLRFIGEVDDRTADTIADALAMIETEPFPVVLDGLESFGGAKPRALYARVEPSAPLNRLQDSQEALLRRLGLDPEMRRFTPHVTLARLKGGVSPVEVAQYLGGRVLLRTVFEATEAVLMSARTSRGGGPYQTEAAYPFG